MTSGTHALILAQSAFEAVCKERDEIKTQADNLAKEFEASKAYAERCKQGCIMLSFAIDRIDYACGEPNEMEVSDYCIHQNEEHVVKRVKEKIEVWHKERDEALALLASEKSTRNAIIAKGVEMEKQLEAMREAINAANIGLQSAMQYILSLPYFGNLEELETTEKVQAALAKLKPLCSIHHV